MPTNGIEGNGVYLMELERKHIQPPEARRLCAEVVQVIRRVIRTDDGRLMLTSDNSTYGPDELVDEASLKNWHIAGTVSVVTRNGLGFRTMGGGSC